MKTPEEVRAQFYKFKERTEKFSSTVDRNVGVYQIELLTEICAQLMEMNALLTRTLGIINVEKLALDLGRVVEAGDVKSAG